MQFDPWNSNLSKHFFSPRERVTFVSKVCWWIILHWRKCSSSLTQPPMMRLKGISRSAQHHDQNYCTFAKESNNNPLLKALGQKGKKPIEHGRARKPGHSISSSTKRENFLVHHSSLGSLGETRRP